MIERKDSLLVESPISDEKFRQFRRNWHSWPTSRISDTLHAFNNSTTENDDLDPPHVQRTGCFHLRTSDLEKLKKELRSWKFIRIHIGARAKPEGSFSLKEQPIFLPMLEPVGTSKPQYFPLYWKPVRMSTKSNALTTAQVADETTELFCREFCNLPNHEIGEIFEAAIGVGHYRINHFSYRSEPKTSFQQSIEDKIKKHLKQASELLINFGISAPFPNHPYRFRPILTLLKEDSIAEESSFTEDPTNFPANFEFTFQCPPICGKD